MRNRFFKDIAKTNIISKITKSISNHKIIFESEMNLHSHPFR